MCLEKFQKTLTYKRLVDHLQPLFYRICFYSHWLDKTEKHHFCQWYFIYPAPKHVGVWTFIMRECFPISSKTLLTGLVSRHGKEGYQKKSTNTLYYWYHWKGIKTLYHWYWRMWLFMARLYKREWWVVPGSREILGYLIFHHPIRVEGLFHTTHQSLSITSIRTLLLLHPKKDMHAPLLFLSLWRGIIIYLTRGTRNLGNVQLLFLSPYSPYIRRWRDSFTLLNS